MITLSQIARVVSLECGVTVKDMKGPRRFRRISQPRQEAFWLARQAKIKSAATARFFNKDKSTVYHGVRHTEDLRYYETVRLRTDKMAAKLALKDLILQARDEITV